MRVVIILAIAITGILIAYFMSQSAASKEHLPVINPNDLEKEMVDSLLQEKGIGHTISKFSFRNQNNEQITLDEVKGCIFVAEYFFTTCGTICPVMNRQMKRVQDAYADDKHLKILSFTVDPDIDTVAQMRRYATQVGAMDGKWHFLTGDKTELYRLARRSFFVLKPSEAANQGDANSDFIHTNNFVLVDAELRIRGYYDGTSSKSVDQLIHDIAVLKKEK